MQSLYASLYSLYKSLYMDFYIAIYIYIYIYIYIFIYIYICIYIYIYIYIYLHLTIDLKKQINIIQVIHSFQNRTRSHYQTIKHLEALAERCYIDQMQKQNASEMVNMLVCRRIYCNILTHQIQNYYYQNQDINPFYHFCHCFDSF